MNMSDVDKAERWTLPKGFLRQELEPNGAGDWVTYRDYYNLCGEMILLQRELMQMKAELCKRGLAEYVPHPGYYHPVWQWKQPDLSETPAHD
jgi:hypothetical protein